MLKTLLIPIFMLVTNSACACTSVERSEHSVSFQNKCDQWVYANIVYTKPNSSNPTLHYEDKKLLGPNTLGYFPETGFGRIVVRVYFTEN